ncbi:4Fe-4S binding protein [Thermoproteota archaeon]
MSNLPHIIIAFFFIILTVGLVRFIKNKWTIPSRGYTQLSLLIVSEVAFFMKRPFCKILCPLGLIYGKLNKFSPLKVKLNKCSGCEKCVESCIADIKPLSESNGELCAKCFNCQVVCNSNKAIQE